MENDYLLVTWVHETPQNWSVMKKNSIEDKEIQFLAAADHLEQELLFKWNKKSCLGRVKAFGTKAEMESKMKLEIRTLKSKEKFQNPNKIKAKQKSNAKKSKIDSLLNEIQTDPIVDEKDQIINKLQGELNEEKLTNEALRKKVDELTAEINVAIQGNKQQVDIGNGILLSAELLLTLKMASATVNIYARSLFKHLFEPHEVIGYSLTGKGCNANKNNPAQPGIDSKRRDAIIGHALQVFNLDKGPLYKLAVKDMKKSLSALILEMTVEARKVESDLINNAELND